MNQQWVPLALTLIEYPKDDFIGKAFAYSSLIPLVILIGFSTLILFRRDLQTLFFFVGIILSELVNYVLKHLIQEPRPMSRATYYTEFGMPSSHSQLVWFFSTYVALFLFLKLYSSNNANSSIENLTKILIVSGCFLMAALVSFSRVYLQYHTVIQVIAGAIIGSILAIIWFTFTNCVFVDYFSQITSWKISELLMIRDTTLIPNILWFEYMNIRQESRARCRKNAGLKNQ